MAQGRRYSSSVAVRRAQRAARRGRGDRLPYRYARRTVVASGRSAPEFSMPNSHRHAPRC